MPEEVKLRNDDDVVELRKDVKTPKASKPVPCS